ncbi:hypothetical protein EYF80_036028 [Liparis tanakae]|uniref:Uncharacterized protein n=1 Tax=Liparis tanakae TaxID=230148 RepID=A0A4Z2GKN8_9TELE|nr:hypothetical protein EYF80_036028 [Liparis tanakae]
MRIGCPPGALAPAGLAPSAPPSLASCLGACCAWSSWASSIVTAVCVAAVAAADDDDSPS